LTPAPLMVSAVGFELVGMPTTNDDKCELLIDSTICVVQLLHPGNTATDELATDTPQAVSVRSFVLKLASHDLQVSGDEAYE